MQYNKKHWNKKIFLTQTIDRKWGIYEINWCNKKNR